MLQQWRLFPYLASAYVLDYFSRKLFVDFFEFKIAQIMGDSKERLVSNNIICFSDHCLLICYDLWCHGLASLFG